MEIGRQSDPKDRNAAGAVTSFSVKVRKEMSLDCLFNGALERKMVINCFLS